jgi:hypothetical protein
VLALGLDLQLLTALYPLRPLADEFLESAGQFVITAPGPLPGMTYDSAIAGFAIVEEGEIELC